MAKRILIIILLFGILEVNHTRVFAKPANTFEVCEGTTNNGYAIQVDVNVKQFSKTGFD